MERDSKGLLRRLRSRRRPARSDVEVWRLSLLALGVGALTGVGSAVFRALIGLFYNLCYLGRFAFALDANQLDPPSPFGDFVLLSPVLGGLAVVWLVKTFAPEAKGHGVPEVMDSIFYKGGDIRGVVAVVNGRPFSSRRSFSFNSSSSICASC